MSRSGFPKWSAIREYVPIIILMIAVTCLVFIIKLPQVPEVQEQGEIFVQSDDRSWNKPSNYSDDTQISGPVPHEVINTITNENKTEEQMTTGENYTEWIINVGVLLGIAVGAAFLIYLLFKLKKRLTIKLFFSIALGTVAVATIFIIFFFFYNYLIFQFDAPYSDLYVFSIGIPISMVGGIGIIYNITSKNTTPKRRNIALICLSGLIAVFLTSVLFEGLLVLLIIGISIWDIYATKRGPIKGIIDITDKDEKDLKDAKAAQTKAAQANARSQSAQAAKVGPTTPQAQRSTAAVAPAALAQNSPGATAPLAKATQASMSSAPATQVQKSSGAITPPQKAPSTPVPAPVPANPKANDLEALQLFGLYDTKEFSIGVGDLIFYSVLMALAMKYFMFKLPYYGFYNDALGIGIAFFIAIVIGLAVLAGFVKTVQLLDRNYILPGLPISMGIGIGCFLVFWAALEIINWIYYGFVAPF